MRFLLVLFVIFLFSCSQESDDELRSRIGKKVFLDRFPDSLDLQRAKELYEYRTDTTQIKKAVAIGLSTKKIEKPATTRRESEVKRGSVQTESDTRTYKKIEFISAERFVELFAQGVAAMQDDPKNSALTYLIKVTQKSTIRAVLKKKYGAHADQIPDALLFYDLQKCNSVDLKNLLPEQTVVVPRIELLE